MKLIWTRELDVQNPWEPDFHGVFFYQESGISFYYKDEHLVRCVHGQMDEPEILFEGKQGISPPLPHDWMIIKQDDALSLLCGERIAIELKTGRSKIPAPDNLQSEYQRRKPSPEHFVEDSFVLNEYQVRHKGEWGYICQKDGQDIWKFGGRGQQPVFRDSRSWRLLLHFEHPYRRPNPQPADRRHDCDPAARLSCVSLHGRGTKKIPTDLRRPDQRQHSGRNRASRHCVGQKRSWPVGESYLHDNFHI